MFDTHKSDNGEFDATGIEILTGVVDAAVLG